MMEDRISALKFAGTVVHAVQSGPAVVRYVNEISDAILRFENDRLLICLRYPEMNARQNAIDESFTETYEYVYHEEYSHEWDSFVRFLEGPDQVYWIRGKRGSGKSCLMRFISRDARTFLAFRKWKPERSPSIIAHFLWNSGSPMQKTAKGLLASLLYQLFEGSPDLVARMLGDGHILTYECINDWSDSELTSTLKKAAQVHPGAICIFIDGLDEIDQDYGHHRLIELVKDLVMLENVKICVSSRPETELNTHFEVCPTLKLEDLTYEDIGSLVMQELEEPPWSDLGDLDPRKLDELVETIVSKAEGVFLWPSYALNILRCQGLPGNVDWDTVQQALEGLPQEIGDLYRGMWGRLGVEEELWRKDAAWYFRFVLESQNKFLTGQHLLALTLAKNRPLRDKIMQDLQVDSAVLRNECLKTRLQLEVLSAGFYVFEEESDPKHLWSSADGDQENDWSNEMAPYGIQGDVGLINRSVREYLYGTPEGQEILKHFRTTDSDVLKMRIRTQMALAAVMPDYEGVPKVSIIRTLADIQTLHAIPEFQDEALEMFRLFNRLCHDIGRRMGKDPWHTATGERFHECFTAVDFVGYATLVFPSLARPLVEKVIGDGGLTAEYATYLLLCASRSYASVNGIRNGELVNGELVNEEIWRSWDAISCFIRRLLEHGADPNATHLQPWGDQHYFRTTIPEHIDSTRIPVQLFKQLLGTLVTFGLDLRPTRWLVLGPWCNHNLSSCMNAPSLRIVVEASLSTSLTMSEILSSGQSLGQLMIGQEGGQPTLRATVLQGELPKHSLSFFELTLEEVTWLAQAINQFYEFLAANGELRRPRSPIEREALWDATVGQIARDVVDRGPTFEGTDAIEALVRLGVPLVASETVDRQARKDTVLEAAPMVW